jgi:hypothetical protein
MDVMVAPARTTNRKGSERNRSSSGAVLSPEPERGHSGAAEYLLELLTVDEIAAALRVSPSGVMNEYASEAGTRYPT